MKKMAILLTVALLCAGMTTALANPLGVPDSVYEIISGDERFSGVTAAAFYQPGESSVEPTINLMGSGEHFTLAYDGNGGSFEFSWTGTEYILLTATWNDGLTDYFSEDNMFLEDDGMLFWASGISDTFTPTGDAKWYTDKITLSEFNIRQMPRTIGQIRRMNATNAALTEDAPTVTPDDADGAAEFVAVPLTAAVDTFLTDDPFGSQASQADIPVGTALTGLAKAGPFYAYVEFTGDTVHRGFVPLKDLQPMYDLAVSADELYADVRWDVLDALLGKWSTPDSDFGRIIIYDGGTWRNHMPGTNIDLIAETAEYQGNIRVYDGENGAYILRLITDGGIDESVAMTLNTDGTITLTRDGGDGAVFTRKEYSTYGNG